jgi:hypothetical protein
MEKESTIEDAEVSSRHTNNAGKLTIIFIQKRIIFDINFVPCLSD